MAIGDQVSGEAPAAGEGGRFFAMNPRQVIKIVVYTLLLLNFIYYVFNDINLARHTAHAGWKWHDWTASFATTLDVAAWLLLLLLFELETYVLPDAAFTPWRVRLMQALRVVCILFIGHAVFAYGAYLLELDRAAEVGPTTLCELTERDLSFARNLEYQELTPANCAEIPVTPPLFIFDQEQLVSDAAGMRIEWQLAWADFMEVMIWLLILAMIEVMVRLQEQGVTGGRALRSARSLNVVLYAALWFIAAYWAFRGHWMFAWDEALWILGFMAIGMNLSEWREEIEGVDAGERSVS